MPDYTIMSSRGIAAYAEAKAGAIPFDNQASGFIQAAQTTLSKTFTYYVPDASAVQLSAQHLEAAAKAGVSLKIAEVR